MYATQTGMTGSFFKELMDWQQQKKKQRSITIEIGGSYHPERVKIWVYDYVLGTGCFVTGPADLPDDEQLREKRKASLLDELKHMEVAA
jgi:hypothetical protein